MRVHLWDLSGSDDYYDTRTELYDKTDGVFITFDVTNQASFDSINSWFEEINKSCSPKPVIILCACKVRMSLQLEFESFFYLFEMILLSSLIIATNAKICLSCWDKIHSWVQIVCYWLQTDLKQKRVITREKGEEWAKQHKMG